MGREEELAEIHRTLRGDGTRRTVVLHGLGGIVKTQLTVAYVKRHKVESREYSIDGYVHSWIIYVSNRE